MQFLDWEGFQPTVIMSDCASLWHIPVGRGNNYLSIPQSTTDLIMIMTFSAAAYSKTCRKSFVLGQLQNSGAHHTGSGPSLYVVWMKVTTCDKFVLYVKDKTVFILWWRQRKVHSKLIQFNGKFWIQWSRLRGRCTIYCIYFNDIRTIFLILFFWFTYMIFF